MNPKSRYAKTAPLFIAAVLLPVFLAACQPTPETPPVVNKNQGALESAVSAAPAPQEKYKAPAEYRDSYQRETVTIDFDANVEVPDATAYPVYNVQSSMFTQDEADRFVDVLMQGQPLISNVKPLTKDQLTEQLLDIQADISIRKSGGRPKYDNSDEEMEQIAADIKKRIEEAPETVPDQIVDSTLVENGYGGKYLDVSADLGGAVPAMLLVSCDQRGGSRLDYKNGAVYFVDSLESEPNGLSVTREEAVREAEQMVSDLGIQDFAVSAATVGSWSGGSESEIDENRDKQGYVVNFTRRLSGIPFTYESRQQIGFESPEDAASAQSWNYERLSVSVDDTGVTGIQFLGKMDLLGKASENVQLKPFEDIIKTFDQQIFTHYAIYNPEYKNAQTPVMSTMHIGRITLGYTRIAAKDKPGEYLLVPVWDFFGSTQDTYDLDAIVDDLEENGAEQDVIDIVISNFKERQDQPVSQGYTSFLTINAVDGSVIDRNHGY